MNKFYDAISYNQLKIPVFRYKWLSIMSYQLDVSLIIYGKSKCITLLFLLRIFIAVSLHVNQVKLKNIYIHKNTIFCIKGQKSL